MWPCFFMFLINRKKKCETRSGKFWNFKLEVVLGVCKRKGRKGGRCCGTLNPSRQRDAADPCSALRLSLTVFISWSYPRDVNKCVFRLWTLLLSFVILVCCIQVQAHHLGFQRFFSNSAFVFKWNSSFFSRRECNKTFKFWGQQIYFPANILSV